MASISDILLEQGRQAAEARRASGALLGNSIATIGQLPAQVMAEKRQNDLAVAKSADDAQARQLRGIQIQREQKAQGDEDKLGQIWASGIIKDDGSIDLPKAQAATAAAGMPEAFPALKELADKWDKGSADILDAHARAAKAQLDLEDLTKEHLGSSGMDLAKNGYQPDEFKLFVAKHATGPNALLDPKDANTLLTHADTPDGVKQIVDGWIQQSPSYLRAHTPAAVTEQKLKDAQALHAQQETLGTIPETPAQKSERENREATLKLAQQHEAEFERNNRANNLAANPFGVGTGSPSGTLSTGVSGPTGDEFLKTLPAAQQGQIKALAEGRQPFPTGMSYARLQPLIAAVTQYDPTFDAANYNARNKARSDFQSPSGTGGKTINALNTALQHAGKLSDLIETLDNTEYPMANTVINAVRNQTGNTAVTNYRAVAPQLAKEIERAWRGTGGSSGDIKDLIESIGGNMGKQQQREALANFVDLVEGKLDATKTQRDNVLGPAGASIPILFPQNQPIIDSIKNRASGSSSSAASPDLTGLKAGTARTFTTGPYSGQKWTIGADGQPKQVGK